MPRTQITSQVLQKFPANGIIASGSLDIVWTPADTANGNLFQSSGRDLLLVWNTDSINQTFTVSSVPDENGRLGNVGPYTMSAGDIAQFLVSPQNLYTFSDGVHLDASATTIKFAILRV